MTPLFLLSIILVCLLLSAFFSGSEIALLRVRKEDIDKDLAKKKSPAVMAAKQLIESTSRLLVTILLGNNVVNILASAAAATLAVSLLGQQSGIIVSTVSMTLLVLVFSEVIPKAIAARIPHRFSYFVSLPLYLIHKLLKPIHFLFDVLIQPLVLFLAGGSEEKAKETTDEILHLARKVKQRTPERKEDEPLNIIASVAHAHEMTVEEIMVPRAEIFAFPISTPAKELIEKALEERYTRIPVYQENLDNIIGVIHFKELVEFVNNNGQELRRIVIPAMRIPPRKPILNLLSDMQHTFSHMAIVKDEFGVTLGLITQEDILEEIVGEIRDEFDAEELQTIKQINEDSYDVLGRLKVIDFNRASGWEIPAEPGDTLSGLVYNQLGRAPKSHDRVELDTYRFRVASVSGNRITRVLITKLKEKSA